MMICNYVFISIWFWSTFMQIRIYIRIYMYIYVKKSVFMQNSMSFFDFLTTTCQVNSTKRQECIHSSRQIPVWPVAPPMAIVVCLDGIVCESILFCFPRYAVIIIKEVPTAEALAPCHLSFSPCLSGDKLHLREGYIQAKGLLPDLLFPLTATVREQDQLIPFSGQPS